MSEVGMNTPLGKNILERYRYANFDILRLLKDTAKNKMTERQILSNVTRYPDPPEDQRIYYATKAHAVEKIDANDLLGRGVSGFPKKSMLEEHDFTADPRGHSWEKTLTVDKREVTMVITDRENYQTYAQIPGTTHKAHMVPARFSISVFAEDAKAVKPNELQKAYHLMQNELNNMFTIIPFATGYNI